MPRIILTEPLPAGEYELTPVTQPVPTPVPPPVPVRHPVGKGFYIWNLSRCGGGDPQRLAALAQQAGVDWVTIKLHDGPNAFNNVTRLPAVLAALRQVGIKVWGWGYEYAIKPVAEAQKAVELTRQFGLEGYMIDVEHQYKDVPGSLEKRQAAMIFCDALRKADPTLPVGLASYRYPSLHPSLAWDVFAKIIDFHNPQIYWMETTLPTSPASQLDKSLAQLKAIKDVPVIPIGVASPNDTNTWRPSTAQLENFYQRVTRLGLPGYCWWSWEHAEARLDVWNTIAAQP